MTVRPPTMPRHKWVLRQLGTFWDFLLGVSLTAGWARYLTGDDMGLPWPLYPLGAALFLWGGVMRLIEDAVEGK